MQSTISRPQTEILQLRGHLNAANASELQSQLHTSVSESSDAILLIDMAQVESLDSAGLMALVSALSLAKSLDRQLSLCAVSPSVRIIFELTQLDRAFKMYPSQVAFFAAMN